VSKPQQDVIAALRIRVEELKAVLRLVEFGNAVTQHKCVACAGWDVGPNGETPRVHTKECPVRRALKGKP
jgi:hypothetical protein